MMVKKNNAHVNLSLPPDLWKRIRMAALEAGVPASTLIADVMTAHLDKKKAKGKGP